MQSIKMIKSLHIYPPGPSLSMSVFSFGCNKPCRSSMSVILEHVDHSVLSEYNVLLKARLYRIWRGVYTYGDRHSAIVTPTGQLLLCRRVNNS